MTDSHETSGLIRVLIADDSAVMRTALARVLESSPNLRVCGTARDGLDVLEKVRQLAPDVVTLDVEMPVMDGMEVLKRIMKDFPRPVIMVSSLTQQGAEVTLEALGEGAFDYISKIDGSHGRSPEEFKHELIAKIEAAALSPLAPRTERIAPLPAPDIRETFHARAGAAPEIIALGTSTGGPKALQDILPQLPPDMPAGMMIVQHMPPGFTAPFAKRLNSLCKLQVREATHGGVIEPGVVCIAQAGMHATVGRKGRATATIYLSEYPSGTLHRPSVDVTMRSVAEEFGSAAMGVIMTGMGSDGLQGMTAIREAGGITIGQDESSSAVYGMPRCCAEHGILQSIVTLEQMPRQILYGLGYYQRHSGLRLEGKRPLYQGK